METIHKKNLELIKKHNLRKGSKLKFKIDWYPHKKGDTILIDCINPFFGWIITKGIIPSLPQEVSKLLKIVYKVKNERWTLDLETETLKGLAHSIGHNKLKALVDDEFGIIGYILPSHEDYNN